MRSPRGSDGHARRRLHTYSLGVLADNHLKRVLASAGWSVTTGWPSADGAVGVWGRKPVSSRGRWVARRTNAQLLTVEDGFLHSVGPDFSQSLSFVIDDLGIYFDASAPSRLEEILQNREFSANDWSRADNGVKLLRSKRISKYTPPLPKTNLKPGYVLVIDQTVGDASIEGAGAEARTFRNMLEAARSENPGARIAIKTHPRARREAPRGHFSDVTDPTIDLWLDTPMNPWDAIEAASVVYTVSSQLGYEALMAGKPVRCFGQAFYAGWGLTNDETQIPRRTRVLDIWELFAGSHLHYPIYYDPWRLQLGSFETAVSALECQRDAALRAPEVAGEVYAGVRLWKRRNVTRFRPGAIKPPVHVETAREVEQVKDVRKREVWMWASRYASNQIDALRRDGARVGCVEDGFLRSVGLGASLTEASSLVFDRQGIYFDPNAPSDLEDLVSRAAAGQGDEKRAEELRRQIVEAGVTKYNLASPEEVRTPEGRHVVLVPGQVEDDASILRGTGEVRTNIGLLEAARFRNPDAWIIYKPHPDVEAGLRKGAIAAEKALALVDSVALEASPVALINTCDELWTMTSLMGFEALLRGKPVTCLGMPFYAGWGLTEDLGSECPRRTAKPTLDQLVWASLIAYPSYVDPVSGIPCSPELVVDRLASNLPGRKAGTLSKLQFLFAKQSWIWR